MCWGVDRVPKVTNKCMCVFFVGFGWLVSRTINSKNELTNSMSMVSSICFLYYLPMFSTILDKIIYVYTLQRTYVVRTHARPQNKNSSQFYISHADVQIVCFFLVFFHCCTYQISFIFYSF